ncbi:hypothetical protein MKX03_023925 [Papaver bracteatum]|nr:hypothetical protein MKX03_023925 [Papaver bracteatum]
MAAVEDGQVIGCDTLDVWKEHFNKGIEAKNLIVANFIATWCGPSRQMSLDLTKIAEKFPDVLFLEVNVQKLKTVKKQWNVEAMPTLVFLKDGNEVDRVVGLSKDELLNKIAKHSC